MKQSQSLFIVFGLVLPIISGSTLTACTGCSKSGRMQRINEYQNQQLTKSDANPGKKREYNSSRKNVIPMREEGGVYYVTIEINGVDMEIIFDTGASSISISSTEAMFMLKQGKLTKNDILGSQQFIDATGKISEGTLIVLRNVKIGNKMLHNIEASIVHNMEAPLLLGQSALSSFGKISIDYNKEEITFE